MEIIIALVIAVCLVIFFLSKYPILVAGVVLICIAIAIWKLLQQREIEELKAKKEIISKYDDKIAEANSTIELAEYKEKRANERVKDIDGQIVKKQQELDSLNEKYKQLKLQKEVELKEQLSSLMKQVDKINQDLAYADVQPFVNDNITSEEYKNKLSIIQLKEKELIKLDEAVDVLPPKVRNNNAVKADIKQILRCFNSEASAIASAVTVSNIDKMRYKLIKSYETLNSIFKTDCVFISEQFLELKLEELNLIYSHQYMKEKEREEQKAIREQMVEEEKARREIEREKAKIDKETAQFKNELNKLMGYMQKASDVEKQIYIDKINELENKLKLLEKDKENVLQREQNTRAGYVYVISNIGSFGENVYKIGMTRRLEPMDRVKELGDASVPFEFDVHAMIFSENAPALESILHNTFRNQQVNKVNSRKEFFRVSLDEIEKVVKDNYNATVTFTKIAEAVQYRESLRIEESQKVSSL